MSLGRRGFLRADEPRPHPDPRSTQPERGRKAAAIVDATGGHAEHGGTEEVPATTAGIDHLVLWEG